MRLIFGGAAVILLVGGLPVGVLATQEQNLDALRRQVEAQQNKLASALASTNNHRGTPEPRFEKLHGSDELRDPRIMDIVQDRFGFLWFGTFSGLVRYDGYEFHWFVSDPQDPYSLSDNRLRKLLVDREGALWAGTLRGGLNRYDPRTGQFTCYRHDPAEPDSLSDDYVRALYEDRDGNLWVGTDNGLNRLNRETGGFDRYLYESGAAVGGGAGEATTIVQAVTEDRDGHLWVGGYGSGLFELVEGVPVASYRHDPRNRESLSDDRIMQLVTDASGTIWVSTWGGGVNAFDVEAGSFRRYRHDPLDPSSLPGDQLLNVWVDQRDAVWVIAVNGGLARLDRDSDRFIRYPHDPGRIGSPSDTLSGAAFEDAEGSVWLGTYGKGVDVWHPSKPSLVHYRAHDGPRGLSADYVNAVREDRGGNVWAGTYNGLDRIDPATGTITTYRNDPTNPNSLSANYTFALHEDRDGMLWVGTWGGGLNRLDLRTGHMTRYPCDTENPHNPNALYDCDARVIYEDTSGSLWVGTYGGLNRFDRRSGRFTHYNHDPQDPSSLSGRTVNDITQDTDGVLWISTANGLNRWVPESRSFVRYQFDPSSPDGLAHPDIRLVHVGRDGTLWLGTSGGLQRLSWDEAGSARFTLYGEDYGLPRFSVVGILDDDEGNLWLATRGDGLWRFNPDTLEVRQLDTTDGLPRGSFELPGWRMRDGRLLFGGVDGLVILDPATVGTNTHMPPVAITEVAIDNESVPVGPDSVLRKPIAATHALTLPPRTRNVSFEFAALDFQAPEKNRYRYQLEGFDEGWRETDASERHVTYTNLNPGKYVFRVKGSNNDGVWNEEGASISVTVMPAWWQTVWFRLLVAASLLGFFFMLHRLRMRYIVEANLRLAGEVEERKKAESDLLRSQGELRSLSGRLVETQEEERRRIARELHDGVNQQLAMLSLRLGILAKRPPNDRDEASRQFEELKKSALGLSRDVRDVSHRLHSSELEHLGLVQALRTECSRVEKESGIKVDLDTDEAPESSPWDPSLCIYRVAQATLLNAIKHSGASRIRVRLGASDGGMELVVSDDGAGFDIEPTKGKAGLGLTSMAERVRYLGGRFQLASRAGTGTEVRAWVPIETAVAKEGIR